MTSQLHTQDSCVGKWGFNCLSQKAIQESEDVLWNTQSVYCTHIFLFYVCARVIYDFFLRLCIKETKKSVFNGIQ